MSGESTYLYRLQPARAALLREGPTPEETKWIEEHFEYLKDRANAGIVLLAGRTLNTDPSGFGIVIFVADSETQAREIMDGDPAVAAGVMRAELYPYRIALLGSALRPLLGP